MPFPKIGILAKSDVQIDSSPLAGVLLLLGLVLGLVVACFFPTFRVAVLFYTNHTFLFVFISVITVNVIKHRTWGNGDSGSVLLLGGARAVAERQGGGGVNELS